MRKMICFTIAVLMLVCIFSGCAPAAGDTTPEPSCALTPVPSPTALPSEPIAEASFAPSAEPSSDPILNFEDEPPLNKQSLMISVPDFLDAEQQLLYRRAHCVYSHLFGADTGEVNIWQEGDVYPEGLNDVEYKGNLFTKACGRYAAWEDFDALVHAVFTDEYWHELNVEQNIEYGYEDGTFVNIDGHMHFVWQSRGAYYYNYDVPDEFELISKGENEIAFTLIGHYKSPWPGEDGPDGYTIEFPIRMVRTQNGWRFSEFHSAWADQDGPGT